MDHMLMTYLEGLSKQMAEIKDMLDKRLPGEAAKYERGPIAGYTGEAEMPPVKHP
jgi:hypothetical protein